MRAASELSHAWDVGFLLTSARSLGAAGDIKAQLAPNYRRFPSFRFTRSYLNLTTTTLYTYVNGDGTPKAAGQAVLDGTHRTGTAAKARSRQPQALRRHAHAAAGT